MGMRHWNCKGACNDAWKLFTSTNLPQRRCKAA